MPKDAANISSSITILDREILFTNFVRDNDIMVEIMLTPAIIAENQNSDSILS